MEDEKLKLLKSMRAKEEGWREETSSRASFDDMSDLQSEVTPSPATANDRKPCSNDAQTPNIPVSC